MAQIFAGLFTEGKTDIRFLQSIVQKTLEAVAFNDCSGQFDIDLSPIEINKTGLGFIEQVLAASKKGQEDFCMMILCVQADADRKTLNDTYQYKINPCQVTLEKQPENEYCKILVAIVPIQETEAWMLADWLEAIKAHKPKIFAPRLNSREICKYPKMKKTVTTPYHVAEHLRTPEESAAYLEACLEEADGDAAFIAKALGDIARARGMSQVARDTGLSDENLYKALSGEQSPGFDTILKVISVLGLKLHVEVAMRVQRA